jgi:hypothetical protein
MKKVLFVFLAAFILSSCFSDKYNRLRFNQKTYDKGGKSYIVLSAQNNAGTIDISVGNFFSFSSDDGDKVSFRIYNGETISFLINPGNYKLTEYILYGSRTYGNVTKSISLDFSRAVKGSFYVKEDEAVYLGCVSTFITDIKRSAMHKFMNFNLDVRKHIDYTTEVKNLFKSDDRAKFESECKKEIVIKLLDWGKIQSSKIN